MKCTIESKNETFLYYGGFVEEVYIVNLLYVKETICTEEGDIRQCCLRVVCSLNSPEPQTAPLFEFSFPVFEYTNRNVS